MDEIVRARVELLQLKEVLEQDLCHKLSRVPMDIEVCKSRIEHLARAKVPINSLPFEILSYVLELVAFSTVDGDRNISPLIKVSRTWRDIILDSPKFWSNIHVDGSTKVSFVRTCTARSCQYPLDIVIKLWERKPQFSALIDDIVPHVHRWRTLEIYGDDHQSLQLVLDKTNHLRLPSLTRATMIFDGIEMHYPTFLSPDSSPALTSLSLNFLTPMEEFPPGQRITSLSLAFISPFGPLMLPSLLVSQHLTTLKLKYCSCPPLQSNSISLPFLTSLTLKAEFPRELISAVLAPQLSYFSLTVLSILDGSDPLSTIFHGCGSKFHNVQHFGLRVAEDSVSIVECAGSISSLFFFACCYRTQRGNNGE